MSDQRADLAELWRWFARSQCAGYSSLYETIALAVAGDDEVLGLVAAAPPSSHLPLSLLAAGHYLLLEGLDHPLAGVYAGTSGADPGPLFLELCKSHRGRISEILATRHIQTNECGRSAVLGPGLTWVAETVAEPLALVDVGTSAGLNLRCDSYRLDYGSHGSSGPSGSPVVIECEVRGGEPPIAVNLPRIATRVGIDRSPVDLTNEDDARWLLACTWPDTGRLERTATAIEMAAADPPPVVAADAIEALPAVLRGLDPSPLAVVVTTWVLGYFPVAERERFVELLASESSSRPIAWLSAEGIGTVDLPALQPVPEGADVLGAIVFDRGSSTATLLGYVHPHGQWMDWRAEKGG